MQEKHLVEEGTWAFRSVKSNFRLASVVLLKIFFNKIFSSHRSPHEKKKKRRSRSRTKSRARSPSPSMSPGKPSTHKNSVHSASVSPVESRESSQERSRYHALFLSCCSAAVSWLSGGVWPESWRVELCMCAVYDSLKGHWEHSTVCISLMKVFNLLSGVNILTYSYRKTGAENSATYF